MIVNRIVTSLAAGSSAHRGGHCMQRVAIAKKLQMGLDIEKGDRLCNLGCLADFCISNMFWIEVNPLYARISNLD